jgi:predicted Zn-dependent protease
MRAILAGLLSIALATLALLAQSPANEQDVVLRAMTGELERSKALRVVDLDKPYYIEYSLEDTDTFNAAATLGGLLASSRSRARVPQVQVRVGDYAFDNTNHVYSGYYQGARYDPEQWPLDNNYGVLRQCFWLATDRAYKAALEGIARKRASLKNASNADTLPDFGKVEPVRSIQNVRTVNYDESQWTNRVVQLSDIFLAYPELYTSTVTTQIYHGISYFANSEGTVERVADDVVELHARASAQAADGTPLHDSVTFASLELEGMPSGLDVRRGVTEVATNVQALLKAPVGEGYSGPVLFEGAAAAQLLAQLIGDNLNVPRRPVTDPGRPARFLASEFESKLNSRILPEWMDVVDDATQKEWRGRPLLGYYPFDMEGVAPKPVIAVEKGVLKSFLTTRQPVKNAPGSNGHARLQGSYGARSAAPGNLFIRASQAKPAAQLKAQFIDMIKQRDKPYGLLVRKLDYPSSASMRELQALFTGMAQSGGSSRPVSPPVLVYRVYPDGREELVRGLRFRGLNVRSLRDIVAASEENYAFDYINNAAPFAMIGAGGFLAPTTVVAPALLFEEVEFEHPQDEQSKPPLVPPPPIETAGR